MRIYIAGPMTGLPQFNYPAFQEAAERVRVLGFHVENPADNPAPPCRTWRGWMRLSIPQLVTCDTVALLPGWEDSRGARAERRVANDLELPALSLERMLPILTAYTIARRAGRQSISERELLERLQAAADEETRK